MSNLYENEVLETVVTHEHVDGKKTLDANSEEVINGMAPNWEEMKQLGKDMQEMKTETQLKEQGLVSDPAQGE